MNGGGGNRTRGRPQIWPGLASAVVAAALLTGCSTGPTGPVIEGRHKTIQSVLNAQSAALLSGDSVAFLADIDAGQPALVAKYRDIFASLRALLVSGWYATVSDVDGEVPMRAPERPIDVTIGYCLGTEQCPTDLPGSGSVARTTVRMSFAVSGGGIVITGLGPAQPNDRQTLLSPIVAEPIGAAPWQISSLHAVSGSRTLVASPAHLQARLPAALAAAEAAAAVADQFALWIRPERYYVYLAGPEEWRTWYGRDETGLGHAVATGARSMDIVVNAAQVSESALESLLRKQMGHVVMVLGADANVGGHDIGGQWVDEGVAELVKNIDDPSAVETSLASLLAYLPAMPRVDAFLDSGHPVDPAAAAAFSHASFLAITYIAYRFGMDALFQFVAAVLREHMPVPKATARTLGITWPDLEAQVWLAVTLT